MYKLHTTGVNAFGMMGSGPIQVYVEPNGVCGGKVWCYTVVQDAIDAATSQSVIHIAEGSYDEDVTLDESKALTLYGGYAASFASVQSDSTMNSLEIAEGTIIPYNIILESSAVGDVMGKASLHDPA